MRTERIHWIDIARGIGIIFVIYGHVLGPQDYRHLIYAFHIPLFFFLSGAVFNSDKYRSIKKYLLNSVKTLLFPYFLFAFIMFCLWLVWLFKLDTANFTTNYILKQFLSIFYGNSNNGLMTFNDILWFLPALFVTRLLFIFIYNFFKKINLLLIALLTISILGYFISIWQPLLKLPFGIESALTGVVFYGAGFLWFRSQNLKQIVGKFKYLIFPVLLFVGLFLSNVDFNNYGHQIDIRLNHLNNYFFFYFDAFAGIFAWISFSIILNKNKLLETLGRNSLILFAWHPIVFTYFGLLLQYIFGKDILTTIKTFSPLVFTLVSIILIIFANRILITLRRLLINVIIR